MLCRGVSAHKVSGLRVHAPRISFTGKEEQDSHEIRRKSASSRLGNSPRASIASEERVDGIALRLVILMTLALKFKTLHFSLLRGLVGWVAYSLVPFR